MTGGKWKYAWGIIGWALAVAFILSGAGCSKSGDSGKVYEMGNAAVVGPLSYTVQATEWRDSLDGENGQRVPTNRFLLVTLAVTNKSAGEVNIPLLTLVDSRGKEYAELDKGDGVPQWLGLLRSVAPSHVDSGNLLFDVPPGGYKLRISGGGDIEHESTALVNLPFNVDVAPAKPPAPMAVPPEK